MGVYKSKHSGPQIDKAVDDIKNLSTKVNTLILENNFKQLNTTNKTIIGAINEVNSKNAETGESVTIDSSLSETSENPVQNKIITKVLNEKASTEYVDEGLATKLTIPEAINSACIFIQNPDGSIVQMERGQTVTTAKDGRPAFYIKPEWATDDGIPSGILHTGTPQRDGHAANKYYVDMAVASVGGGALYKHSINIYLNPDNENSFITAELVFDVYTSSEASLLSSTTDKISIVADLAVVVGDGGSQQISGWAMDADTNYCPVFYLASGSGDVTLFYLHMGISTTISLTSGYVIPDGASISVIENIKQV